MCWRRCNFCPTLGQPLRSEQLCGHGRDAPSTQPVLGWEPLHFFFIISTAHCAPGCGGKTKQASEEIKSGGEDRSRAAAGVWRGNALGIAACPSGLRQDFLHLRLGLPLADVTGWSSGSRRLDE